MNSNEHTPSSTLYLKLSSIQPGVTMYEHEDMHVRNLTVREICFATRWVQRANVVSTRQSRASSFWDKKSVGESWGMQWLSWDFTNKPQTAQHDDNFRSSPGNTTSDMEKLGGARRLVKKSIPGTWKSKN